MMLIDVGVLIKGVVRENENGKDGMTKMIIVKILPKREIVPAKVKKLQAILFFSSGGYKIDEK